MNSQNMTVKRSIQWLEMMELAYESLSNSSGNDQEEEEKKEEVGDHW